MELDWSRAYIEKDFSISIWGELAAVTIKEKGTDKSSAHWFTYDAGAIPIPEPTPTPTPESCTA
jgi:hypothetical protein